MKYGIQTVSLRSLMRRPWLETEMRVRVNERKVNQYAEEKKAGDEFPPPVVFVDPPSELFWTGDGFHRILADKKNGAKEMEVDLRRGTKLDAILYNIAANKSQRGLPFESGDKTRAVETLLARKETAEWTQAKIAETVGCSGVLVSQVARRLGYENPDEVVDKNGHVRMLPRRMQPAEVEERRRIVSSLYPQYSKRKLATHLGVGVTTIARDLEALDVTLKTCPHCGGTGKIKK